jgi:hypothetical protein
MAVNIKLKRSNVPGQVPSPSSLELGELALNTSDGKAFMKKSDGNVVEIGSSPSSSISASYADTAGFAITAGSASYSNISTTSSYSLVAVSSSYALTASNIEGGTANYLPLWLNNTKLTSSIVYQNASGIGINDISPTHKLQVSGDSFIYNSSNTLNSTKYAFLPALNVTTTGTETNQWANVGIYGSLGYSATTGTFIPRDNSFLSTFLGNVIKSGGANVSGKMSSYAAASNFSGNGNVTTVAGFRAYAPLQSFSLPSFNGTLTNYIGLLIDDITGTTDIGSRVTNKWGIYQSGSLDKNYFAGSTIFAGGLTGSLEGTASYVLNTVSASYAVTASSADNFLVRGTLTAQTIVTQYITSSTSFITGSTKFGTLSSNTHEFTGSISVSGSLSVNGSNVILSNQTSSMSVATASFASTSSYVNGLNLAAITTGSIFASVDVDINNLFLIKSGSSTYFNIASNSNTTLYSDLFIIKNFTTQQPVLTISQSIVQFATQSFNPSGTTTAGSIWFTSSSMYIGLET